MSEREQRELTLSERQGTIGGIPVVFLDGEQSCDVAHGALAAADERAPTPRRREGTARHNEVDSFIAHVKRFAGADSVVFADVAAMRLTAIFDYHPAGAAIRKPNDNDGRASWCKHRSTYEATRSSEWLAWSAIDGKMMAQDDFGDFIEAHLEDLASGEKGEGFPAPMAILELARDLRIHVKGRFERKLDPRTGDHSLVCRQETESTSTSIPRAFLVGLRVFEGSSPYRLEARMRVHLGMLKGCAQVIIQVFVNSPAAADDGAVMTFMFA